ncbi:MAG: right-handed parallel beta-helix repeat-containing protein [Pseudomonadota bacterium]
MKKTLAYGLLVLASASAQATNYYFSDCQAGADAMCVPGNDANPGTSPTAPKRSLAAANTLLNSASAGDQILLAKNGSWTPEGTAFYTGNDRGRASNHIVIADYTPNGYSGSAKPLIKLTGKAASCLIITTNGDIAHHKEGFTFKNIKCMGKGMTGAAADATGIFTYNDTSDVLLENLDISGFGIGVYPGPGNEPSATTARLTLRNSYIHDNSTQGLFGGGPATLIEGNTFDNNGFYPAPLFKYHNIYLAVPDNSFYTLSGSVVRGNTLTRSGVCNAQTSYACGTMGQCQSVSLVVHGVTNDLVIENNIIDETPGATGTCYGIQVAGGSSHAESYAGTIVRGNRVSNVGSTAIELGSCQHCQIEDNVIAWTASPQFTVQGVVANTASREDAVGSDLTIRNNSIYITGTSTANTGIFQLTGSGNNVVNNLIFFGANTSASARCFNTTNLSIANFNAFDYNLCYSDRPDHAVQYSQAYAKLAGNTGAQAAGFDVHGKNVNPLITMPSPGNGYSMALSSLNSPAASGGHPSLSKRLGYHGALSPNSPSFIGAYPYRPLIIAPASPTPY